APTARGPERAAALSRRSRVRLARAPQTRRVAATLLPVLSVAPPGGVPGLRAARRVRARSARGGRGRGGADPPQSSLRRSRADGASGGRGHAQALVMRCRWISASPPLASGEEGYGGGF